jgi:hypothetical protein
MMDSAYAIRLTLPWTKEQTSTNCIDFLDKAGEPTGLQLMNPNQEDISACDIEIADFVLNAINSQGKQT